MPLLASRLLCACLAQTFGAPHEPIRRRGQVAIVAVFCQLLSQQRDLLLQQVLLLFQHAKVLLVLLDEVLVHLGLFSEQTIFFSQMEQFFFLSHALTLHFFAPFDKSLVNLSSYDYFQK
jgi:hypothetical protein